MASEVKTNKVSPSTGSTTEVTGLITSTSDASGDVLYHDGTNFTRLERPVTPADEVLTFATSATAPSWAAAAAGGLVLKVYETNLNTTVTTTSGSYVTSGLSITTDAPASTSSRFLLTLLGGEQLGTVNYDFIDTTFYVGGSEVSDTGPYEQYMYHVSTPQNPHAAQMIHSPASVSAQTYAVFYKKSAGSGTISFNVSPTRVVFTVTELSS